MLLTSIKRHKIKGIWKEVGETYDAKDRDVSFLTKVKWAKKADPPASRAALTPTESKDSQRRYQRKEMLPE